MQQSDPLQTAGFHNPPHHLDWLVQDSQAAPKAPARQAYVTSETTMSDQPAPPQELYEGFEIHVLPSPIRANGVDSTRYTYTGYVCHPGANPALPGHVVPFHADGDDSFHSPEAAMEAVHVARSIVDGTHPDLSVLSLVTHGY